MINATHTELMNVLLGAQDLIAPVVAGHGKRVAMFSCMIAEIMGYSAPQLERLEKAAKLHDIGCFALSIDEKEDLHRFDVLSPAKHCAVGYLLLSQSSLFGELAEIVLHHHANWNESKGKDKQGNLIPEEAYIIHIADRIDILINDKYNILQQSDDIAKSIINRQDNLFHPKVVSAFKEVAYLESFWLRGVHPANAHLSSAEDAITLTREELLDFTRMLTLAIDYKSRFTATHSSGVAATSAAMGKLAGLKNSLALSIAGYLHDLGKLIVPNEILEKKGPLDKTERAIMNSHPFYTYVLLNEAKGLAEIALIAGMHQEKINGEGYPFHPSPNDFPLASRILAVCDVFTALAEDRPYRQGLSKDQVLDIMRDMVRDQHLAPDCFAYLESNYHTFDSIRIAAQEKAQDEYCGFWNKTEEVIQRI
ncbi:HD-GYP domain-containing protein [Oleidesulfovibrio sp.]|uniref:HD-GYP domain-containing protein n=1 Tax=Oleidesulfovibrio sp. TaxID=2909707 RepID=UPI003A8BB92D